MSAFEEISALDEGELRPLATPPPPPSVLPHCMPDIRRVGVGSQLTEFIIFRFLEKSLEHRLYNTQETCTFLTINDFKVSIDN